MTEKTILTRKEAALLLATLGYPVAPRTLARLATDRRGPAYQRFLGRFALYDRTELLDWARTQCVPAGNPNRASVPPTAA